jgi:hypothetical protein
MNPLTISWHWYKRCQGRSRKRWIFNLKLSWKAKEIEIRLAKSLAECITFFHKYVLFYSLELQMQFYSRTEEVCNLHKSLRVSSNEFIFWLSSYNHIPPKCTGFDLKLFRSIGAPFRCQGTVPSKRTQTKINAIGQRSLFSKRECSAIKFQLECNLEGKC